MERTSWLKANEKSEQLEKSIDGYHRKPQHEKKALASILKELFVH